MVPLTAMLKIYSELFLLNQKENLLKLHWKCGGGGGGGGGAVWSDSAKVWCILCHNEVWSISTQF